MVFILERVELWTHTKKEEEERRVDGEREKIKHITSFYSAIASLAILYCCVSRSITSSKKA